MLLPKLLLTLVGASVAFAHSSSTHKNHHRPARQSTAFKPTLALDQVRPALNACGINQAILVDSTQDDFEQLTEKVVTQVDYAKTAQVVALPHTTRDVSNLIKCIRTKQIPFVVLAGGHKMVLPSANAPPGLVINLEKLKTLQYDQKTQLLTVGAGLKWGPVYTYMEQVRFSFSILIRRYLCVWC